MAKIYHGAGHEDTTSQAELDLLKKFEELPNAYTVIHSVPWITHPSKDGTVGEVDFLIIHPEKGVLVTEVKGGKIRIERRGKRSVWFSNQWEIKDPCAQAERSRWRLKTWLDNDNRTKRLNFGLFPLVIMPDSHITDDIRMDCTREMLLDMSDVDKLQHSIDRAYDYWNERYKSNADMRMAGKTAVDALLELVIPTRKLSPSLTMIFERERRKIEELTENQFRVLRRMRKFHRAAIVGGAGTGKTMLAMEKANQLAQAGMRVLYLCFNKPLSEWVSGALDDENIVVATYHSLVGQAIHWAQLPRLRQNKDFYDKAAEHLLDAAMIIKSPGSGAEDKLFDAIIVDEAQDFEDEWWIPLPDLLKDKENGIFYVFFDDNQRIYTQISNVPMEERPFYLDENCRTTQKIHEKMMPYTHTDDEIIALGPEGRAVAHIETSSRDETRDILRRSLAKLISEYGMAPEEIVVLTPVRKKSMWKELEQLGNLILTWDMSTDMKNAVRVNTIYSYKGLESSIVILTELDKADEDIRDQLIYVGLSRARNHVIVIGEFPEPQGETS